MTEGKPAYPRTLADDVSRIGALAHKANPLWVDGSQPLQKTTRCHAQRERCALFKPSCIVAETAAFALLEIQLPGPGSYVTGVG